MHDRSGDDAQILEIKRPENHHFQELSMINDQEQQSDIQDISSNKLIQQNFTLEPGNIVSYCKIFI